MSKINIPAGWKLVPVEPTLEMGWAYLEAARKTSPHTDHAFNHPGYYAMLAAAPIPPVDAVLGEPVVSAAARDLMAERRRQVEVEGYSPNHDAAHGTSELSLAAAAYALSSVHGLTAKSLRPWLWETRSFKPKHPYRDLERAGALVLAAMECWQRRFSKNLASDQEFIESRRLAAPVASRAVQAEPVWFAVETPGADFDVSFVSTMEEALQLNEGDPDAASYITPLYDRAPTAPAATAEPAVSEQASAHPEKCGETLCACRDRPASQCDEEWGPNCDMGNNETHVRRAPEDSGAAVDATLGIVRASEDATSPSLSFCGGRNPPIVEFKTATLEWEDEHAGEGVASLALREPLTAQQREDILVSAGAICDGGMSPDDFGLEIIDQVERHFGIAASPAEAEGTPK